MKKRIFGIVLCVAICLGLSMIAQARNADDCWNAAAKCFVAPGGGVPLSGEFRLNYWNVPPVLPTGTVFPVKVSFTRTRGNPNAVICANMIGNWNPSHGFDLRGVRMLSIGRTAEAATIIKTPNEPGLYRLRLFIRQDFRPTQSFYGKDDHVWSEVLIKVIRN